MVALVIVARIWLTGHPHMTTYLGILSAGVAIALKDPLANLAGWFFLVWRRPFKEGDRVQIGEHAGDVLEIRLFSFSMLEIGGWVDADQSTGRVLHIPNGRLFSASCANYTEGFEFIWHEIPVVLTFESDWERAHEILTAVVAEEGKLGAEQVGRKFEQLAEEHRIAYHHLTPIVWVSVVDCGVRLTMRFLCHARSRRGTSDRIWRKILAALREEPGIDLAYPTWRLFDNPREGKAATAGAPRPQEPA